jgi:hypothetical protein
MEQLGEEKLKRRISDNGNYASEFINQVLAEIKSGISATVVATYQLISNTIKIYNEQRPHGSCNFLTPQEAHQQEGLMKKRGKTYPRKKAMQSEILILQE